MMKKGIVFLLILTMALSTFLVGCQPKEPTATDEAGETTEDPVAAYPGSERGNILTVGGTSPQGTFNPITYQTAYDWYLIELMFDPLLRLDKEGNLVTEGSLTESYKVSEDGLVYTFKLREGIKWHDGVDVTADDVVFTYNSVFKPDYKGRAYGAIMQDIVGAQDVKDGKVETASGVKALDSHTVEITVKQAKATTLRGLAERFTPIPKHYYDKATSEEMAALDRDPLGNGAFKLKKYEVEQYVEFEPNKDYWQGAPKLDGIIWKVVARENELSEFEVGSIDAVNFENSIENYEIIEGYDHGNLLNTWNNGYAFVAFNFSNPIFQDKNVRQALTYGLDRAGFVQSFFGDLGGKVAHTPISPVSWAYPADGQLNEYAYNPEKAIELLEASGWKVGADGIREKDGKKLSFKWVSYNEAEWSTKITALAAEQWKKIGAECEIVLMDFNSLGELISDAGNKDKWDMYNMAWGLTGDPDMYSTFSKTTLPPGNNRGFFSNDEIEELMVKGLEEFDQEKRKEIYLDLANKFNEELPYIFVYVRMNPWLVNKRVNNFNPSEFIYWSTNAHLIEVAQ